MNVFFETLIINCCSRFFFIWLEFELILQFLTFNSNQLILSKNFCQINISVNFYVFLLYSHINPIFWTIIILLLDTYNVLFTKKIMGLASSIR